MENIHGYDVVATYGSYEKDGQKKYLTDNVGKAYVSEKGVSLKLKPTFNPAGCLRSDDGSVWLRLFPPRTSADTAPAPKPAKASDPFHDDIPF